MDGDPTFVELALSEWTGSRLRTSGSGQTGILRRMSREASQPGRGIFALRQVALSNAPLVPQKWTPPPNSGAASCHYHPNPRRVWMIRCGWSLRPARDLIWNPVDCTVGPMEVSVVLEELGFEHWQGYRRGVRKWNPYAMQHPHLESSCFKNKVPGVAFAAGREWD